MKSVSAAYKASMKQILRNPSLVRVVFQNLDTSVSADGAWTDNGHTPFSELETLNYERKYGPTFATLELNRWALDGTFAVYGGESAIEDGFVSSFMSDEDGAYSAAPVLTREFSAVHRLSGLTLAFDTRANEWPVSVTFNFYLNGEIVDTLTLEGLLGSAYSASHPVERYDKITVTPSAVLPHRRFRVETVLFGVTREYGNAEIISTHQSHDIDPLSRRLPSENFSFTILDFEHHYDPDNPQGIYAYVEEKSPVSVAFGYQLNDGTVEWVKPDRYLLNAKPSVRNERATFSATGLIGSLTDIYYKSQPGSKSLYDMAEAVLTDAGLTPTPMGENPWVIDESLRDMFTTGILPIDTHMNCLQLIAHAARCRLFTDDDNIIHIEPFTVTVLDTYRGTTADNGHTPFSEWQSVDAGSATDKTYATLELNRWILDSEGAQEIAPETGFEKLGYASSAVSRSDGAFDQIPVVTRVFDTLCDLRALRIRFDSATGEWPRALEVNYFDNGALVDTQTVSDISEEEIYVLSPLATHVDRVTIAATLAAPYRRFRVSAMRYRSTDFYLDFTTISERSQVVTKIDQLKSVSVAQYAYLEAEEAVTLYSERIQSEALHVEFPQPAKNVVITVDEGEVLSSAVYGRAVDLTLTEGLKTVTVTGVPLTESTVTVTTPVNASGEVDAEENPLITTEEMRSALTEHVIKYLSMRSTYDADYRGNPEVETGDLISMQTRYTDDLPVLVLTDEISFSGGLRGKIKAKGMVNP